MGIWDRIKHRYDGRQEGHTKAAPAVMQEAQREDPHKILEDKHVKKTIREGLRTIETDIWRHQMEDMRQWAKDRERRPTERVEAPRETPRREEHSKGHEMREVFLTHARALRVSHQHRSPTREEHERE